MINNKKVVTNLIINFQRKDKINHKDIFIIMTDNMEQNIKKLNNIQYFMNVTYNATSPNTQKYKLLTLLTFNRMEYKSIICRLDLDKITIDYSRAEKNAILYLFSNIQIIPCFYHFMINCCKKLKELKSKTNTIKQAAKDCLANIKLLCFIPLNKFDYFYEFIKKKYRCKFSNFLNISINIIQKENYLIKKSGIIVTYYYQI